MSRAPFNSLVIPFRWSSAGLLYAVFYRSRIDMCQFISGGGEGSETPFEAAIRESAEEGGIHVPESNWVFLDAKASIPRSAFPKPTWPENVHVITEHSFGVLVDYEDFQLSHEHKDFKWLQYEPAFNELTWDSNRVALYELNRRLLGNAQPVAGANTTR